MRHLTAGAARSLLVTGVIAVLGALLLGGVPTSLAQSTVTTDALLVVKQGETPSNSELSVLLSQSTPLPDTSTVVMGRSDVFADSLASGVLQADSPLLLVPPQGPIPAAVQAELDRLSPQRVILLGGETAIGAVVADELAGRYSVERRAGQTRIETAIEVARTDAPAATTAILSRAFPAAGGDDTQAFADALAAGGMSARMGWPVLLTTTDRLADSTRSYLAGSSIRSVSIIGGTSAIGQGIQDELESMGMTTQRIAGPTRFDTAVAVADALGANGADDVGRVTLVEGQGSQAWAGGFAAAAHSAHFDAPIVLSAGEVLPQPTAAFLSANTAASSFAVPTTDVGEPVLTCVTPVEACEEARVELGLPPSAQVTFIPRSATPLMAGQDVSVTVSSGGGSAFAQSGQISIAGTCLDQPSSQPAQEGTFTVTASSSLPQPCTIEVSVPLENGSTQQTVATYPGGTILGSVASATTGQPIGGASVTLSDGQTTATGGDGTFTFTDLPGGTYGLSVAAEDFAENDTATVDVAHAQESSVSILLSPTLAAGQLRIVLSWDDNPSDLDSHLWLPATQPYHLYYANRGQLETCPFAALDIDDTTGFGPETITITQAVGGSYRYAVHRFSGGETLSQSSAVVQVFDSGGMVASYPVPQNGTEEQIWWHVFDLDAASGTITPANRLLTAESAVEPYTAASSC